MAIRGREAWVEKLSKKEMPVLAGVVQELNQLTGDDDAEVNQLAEVILKDAHLTSQILRIANSVQYNPSSYPINTISRAIILVGFSGVRAICISVMVIDSLLGKKPRERVLEQLAQSFHAAAQARYLMRRANQDVQEEVFIAALLYHLGEMSFWSTGGSAVDTLDALLLENKFTEKQAVDEVLGCSFKSISKSLADIWNLGETLEQSLYPPSSPSPKVVAVCLGEQLSRAATKGWDSSEALEIITKISKFSGVSVADVKKSVMDTADEAVNTAITYGAAKICHLIPSRNNKGTITQENRSLKPLKADPQLQLNILRELSNALMEKLDVNSIFQMVLEGLHRGIGLERVALAFVSNKSASAKYILGQGTDEWRQKFNFSLGPMDDNIFTKAIKIKEPMWFKKSDLTQLKYLYSEEIINILGCRPSFVAGVFLNERCIAIFYADRWQYGGELTDEQFQSFRHFILQTQMSLQMLASGAK
jgi:HD-like signal output (HDOD) protein